MPNLLSSKRQDKYSTFYNEVHSVTDDDFDGVRPAQLFTKVEKTRSQVKKTRNSFFCFSCCGASSDSVEDDVDAAFALVQYDRSIPATVSEPKTGKGCGNGDAFKSSSRTSTMRSSDRPNFLEDIINCRDNFLKMLEYSYDGTLSRRRGLAISDGFSCDSSSIEIPLSKPDDAAWENDICSSDLYSGINSTSTLRSSSPIPSGHCLNNSGPQDHEDDIGRLVAMHNRSGLQVRCESLASVYSGAGEGVRGTVVVRGAVQFALLYNYRLGSLDVVVKRCQDLAPVDTKRNKSDPYVKVYLLPDKSKGGKRKTRVRKGTLQPVWDETLRFSAPLAALASRTLWLSVWHADLLGRNDFLGEVRLPLGNRTFDDTQPQWYTLQERTELFDDNQGTKGDLIVALKFELPDHVNVNNLRAKGTLHVLVKEAKNLCASKSNGLADAFCKSYLLPERSRAAKQKTVVVRRSLNPKWEHCFSYGGISASELRTRALELSVWDRDRFSSNDFMGGIRFSLGTGIYGGSAVDWMDSIGKEVTLWETMLQRHNFWVEGSLPLRPSLSS